MKNITIIGLDKFKAQASLFEGKTDLIIEGPEEMSVSDGFHLMEELYDHRITLFIALCKAYLQMDVITELVKPEKPILFNVWRSKNHSDGKPAFDGKWYVLGVGHEKGKQITYHIPIERWEETHFIPTLPHAPEFDGHTSNDVLGRLKLL